MMTISKRLSHLLAIILLVALMTSLPAIAALQGDVNEDGTVDILDVRITLQPAFWYVVFTRIGLECPALWAGMKSSICQGQIGCATLRYGTEEDQSCCL